MDQAAVVLALAKVEQAKKDCDLVALKKALQEAKTAGAPSEFIDQAMQEVCDIENAAKNDNDTQDNAEVEAREWKEKGNAKLKEGNKASLAQAIKCYTSGVNVAGLKHRTLMAQLYGNRAHAYTLAHSLVDAVDDCRKSIDLDASNMKIYWRAARASMLNELFQQAIEFCDVGLEVQPTNADLLKMKEQCVTRLDKRQTRRANPQEAMETQDRVNQLRDQTVSCAMQIQSTELRKKQASLTLEELSTLPTDVRTFSSCGRAFLLSPQDTIKEKLCTSISSLNEDLPKLAKAREELDKRRMGAEKELQELIQTLR